MDTREKYMARALELARLGAGRVSPNPMVGCVIVKGQEIIGEGYHQVYGQDHAEVDALKCCKRLGNDPAGATMYVTLEPCCHHGKTPPCTDAIKAAGIAAVEIATVDEFPQVAGKGVEILKAAGVNVTIGLGGDEARELNFGFFKRVKTGRPCVILKWAQSIDGKLTFRDGDGRRWFTGSQARIDVHRERNVCDAIMVGANTCRADDPMLNVRLPEVENNNLRRIVLDTNLLLPMDRHLFNTPDAGPVFVITSRHALEADPARVEQLEAKGCEVLVVGQTETGHLDLSCVLDELGRLGVCNLMVEGGARLLNSFIETRLADRALVYISPIIVGEGAGVKAISFARTISLANVKTRLIQEDMRVQGQIVYE